jgi:hypothetical protein
MPKKAPVLFCVWAPASHRAVGEDYLAPRAGILDHQLADPVSIVFDAEFAFVLFTRHIPA